MFWHCCKLHGHGGVEGTEGGLFCLYEQTHLWTLFLTYFLHWIPLLLFSSGPKIRVCIRQPSLHALVWMTLRLGKWRTATTVNTFERSTRWFYTDNMQNIHSKHKGNNSADALVKAGTRPLSTVDLSRSHKTCQSLYFRTKTHMPPEKFGCRHIGRSLLTVMHLRNTRC